MASTTDGDEHRAARAERPEPNSGNQPRWLLSQSATGGSSGAKHGQSPEAEDDRRHGGQQVDDEGQRPGRPAWAGIG